MCVCVCVCVGVCACVCACFALLTCLPAGVIPTVPLLRQLVCVLVHVQGELKHACQRGHVCTCVYVCVYVCVCVTQARVDRLASELEASLVRCELLSAKGQMYDELRAKTDKLHEENQRLQV